MYRCSCGGTTAVDEAGARWCAPTFCSCLACPFTGAPRSSVCARRRQRRGRRSSSSSIGIPAATPVRTLPRPALRRTRCCCTQQRRRQSSNPLAARFAVILLVHRACILRDCGSSFVQQGCIIDLGHVGQIRDPYLHTSEGYSKDLCREGWILVSLRRRRGGVLS